VSCVLLPPMSLPSKNRTNCATVDPSSCRRISGKSKTEERGLCTLYEPSRGDAGQTARPQATTLRVEPTRRFPATQAILSRGGASISCMARIQMGRMDVHIQRVCEVVGPATRSFSLLPYTPCIPGAGTQRRVRRTFHRSIVSRTDAIPILPLEYRYRSAIWSLGRDNFTGGLTQAQ